MATAIGIDLGTTFSAAARVNPTTGRPEIIHNAEREPLTPSVVWFGTDPPTVGQDAKAQQALGATDVASFFKRGMGDPYFVVEFNGKSYTPVDLSALVLAKIKRDCESALGEPVTDAVVTVPAYFGNTQREKTIEAGRQAGLNVLRIINEPTAAALAYGVGQAGRDETALVYDLGGGTFDVTLVRIGPADVTVLGSDGDHELGGKDWDDRVAQYLGSRFRDEHGFDPLATPESSGELLVRCEEAKRKLSQVAAVPVSIDCNGVHGKYELTRDKLEELTTDLLERTARLCEQVLRDAKLGWADLTGVLLVGGSSNMPMVAKYVERMSGKPPRAGVQKDLAVAMGAAVQAAMDAQAKAPAGKKLRIAGERRVQDVTGYTLGVIAASEDQTRFVNSPILPRNSQVPAHGEKEYTLLRGGGEVECVVYVTEGEGTDPRNVAVRSRYVCRAKAAGFGKPVRAVVSYAYDRNSTIQVTARLLDGNVPMEVVPEPVGDLGWLSKAPGELNTFDPKKLDLVVSPPNFDDIGGILGTLGLPHRAWDGSPLASHIVFLNCGSPQLPAPADLARYAEAGGCVYASDLTFPLIEAAFPGLFQFAGATGDSGGRAADIVDPELRTRVGKTLTVHFDLAGWAEMAGVSSNATVLLRDQRTGRPLMAVGEVGSGKVFFTSFHNRSQASDVEQSLLQLLVAKQISTVSGVPIEVVTRATGIKVRR